MRASGEVTAIDRASAISAHGTVYVIPTEDEWYKAAYYDGDADVYYDYPTGSDDMPDGINYIGDTSYDAVFADKHNQGQPSVIDNAGVLSPYGTMGQGGNVSEWNEATIDLSRGMRGGFWNNSHYYLAAFERSSSNPTYEYYGMGFRVASVPEPGSLAMLLSVLLSFIYLRRWK